MIDINFSIEVHASALVKKWIFQRVENTSMLYWYCATETKPLPCAQFPNLHRERGIRPLAGKRDISQWLVSRTACDVFSWRIFL